MDSRFRNTISIRDNSLYLSPELREIINTEQDIAYDLIKSDVYSLGLIFLEMASLTSFTVRINPNNATQVIKDVINSIRYDQETKDLLCYMLEDNPSLRPTFSNIFCNFSTKKILNINNEENKINIKIINKSERKEKKIKNKEENKIKNNEANKKEIYEENEIKNNEENKQEIYEENKQEIYEENKQESYDEIYVENYEEIYEENEQEIYEENKTKNNEENKQEIYEENQNFEVTSFQEILIQEEVCKIQFGVFYKCLIKSSNVVVGAKVYNLEKKNIDIIKLEQKIIQMTSDRRSFLKFYGFFIENNKYYLIIEFISNSLFKVITQTPNDILSN